MTETETSKKRMSKMAWDRVRPGYYRCSGYTVRKIGSRWYVSVPTDPMILRSFATLRWAKGAVLEHMDAEQRTDSRRRKANSSEPGPEGPLRSEEHARRPAQPTQCAEVGRSGRPSPRRGVVAMPLYYSDPEIEPRDCPTLWARVGNPKHPKRCQCKGTGRLGTEGAEPDVWVGQWGKTEAETVATPPGEQDWYYNLLDASGNPGPDYHGPYPTESEALTAAREAVRKGD